MKWERNLPDREPHSRNRQKREGEGQNKERARHLATQTQERKEACLVAHFGEELSGR